MAAFKAHGEKLCAQLLALILQEQGLPTRFLDPQDAGFLVSNVASDAQVLPETYQNLLRWREVPEILVVPGFYGVTTQGKIATFSRGGSDITGSIWARGIKADLYENLPRILELLLTLIQLKL